LAPIGLGCRNQYGFRRGYPGATFGFGIGQAQFLSLRTDLPCRALQNQKPAQRFIRWGGLREQRFHGPKCQPPHGRHHGGEGRSTRGRFGESHCRRRFRPVLALLGGIQGTFRFLHPRRHGDPLPRKPALFCRCCFRFPRGGFGGGAAGGGGAARFFQRLTRRLREAKAGQRQQA
jgi:hypothetical protein